MKKIWFIVSDEATPQPHTIHHIGVQLGFLYPLFSRGGGVPAPGFPKGPQPLGTLTLLARSSVLDLITSEAPSKFAMGLFFVSSRGSDGIRATVTPFLPAPLRESL